MKLTILLTAVCLGLSACGSGSNSAPAQSNAAPLTQASSDAPDGLYEQTRTLSNGDVVIVFALFTPGAPGMPGYFESRAYTFPGGAMGLQATFVKFVGKVLSAENGNYIYQTTYSTCASVYGQTIPSEGVFTETAGNNDSINVQSPLTDINAAMRFDPGVTDFNSALDNRSTAGRSENTNCTGI